MGGLLSGFLGEDERDSGSVGGLFSGLDPKSLGMLMAGARMMEMSGPSLVPRSFGQVLGSGVTAGLSGYMTGQEQIAKREQEQQMTAYRKAQTAALLAKANGEQTIDNVIAQRFGLGRGGNGISGGVQQSGRAPAGGGVMPVPSFGNPQPGGLQASQPGGMGGEPFPFTLNDIALLKLRGRDMTDVFKLATEPYKMEAGATYVDRATGRREYMPKVGEGMTFGPDGGVSLLPGYAESNAGVKGTETRATEGAKAEFTPLPLGYIGQDGRPLGGSVAEYLKGGQGQGSTRAPTPGVSPAYSQAFPRVDPAMQRDRDAESLRIIQGEYASERNPANRAALAREIARLQANVGSAGGRPALQSEAERTQQVGAVTARQVLTSKLNENWITQSFNPVVEAGRSASSITASLDALNNINLQTGWGTEAQAHAASVLTSLGVAPRNVKFFAANAEKFQSVAMDRLLTTLQAQKGPQTEGDATRAQQAFAQLKNTPEANRFITDFARAKANYDARRAQFYQEALPLAQQSGDLNEIDRRWRKIQGSIWSDPVLQRYVRRK